MPILPIRLPLAAVACVAFAVPVLPAFAQTRGGIIRVVKPVPVTEQPAPEVALIDVSFAGGTLAGFVEAVRQAARPEPVNVVLLGSAADLPIPKVELRRVTAGAAFRAVCPRSDAEVDTIPSGGQEIITIESRTPIRQLTASDVAARNEAVAKAQQEAMLRARFGVEAAPSSTLRVFSVRDLVDGETVTYATVLDALKTTLAATGGGPEAEVLFHEASGVLIVRGTPEQQGTATQLLAAVRDSVQAAERAEAKRARERDELTEELREFESRARQAAQELAYSKTLLKDAASEPGVDRLRDPNYIELDRAAGDAAVAKEEAEARVRSIRARLEDLGATNQSPSRAHDSGFTTLSPTVAMDLFTSLNKMLQAGGWRGYIEVTLRKQAEEGSPSSVSIQFVGSDEAYEHFKVFMDDLRRLGMFDGKAHE